jgi:hypothetical protein
MLLRAEKRRDPRALIALGQISLIPGILLLRHVRHVEAGGEPLWAALASDFGLGFLSGLGGTLLGVSIVLQLTGLWRLRWRRED